MYSHVQKLATSYSFKEHTKYQLTGLGCQTQNQVSSWNAPPKIFHCELKFPQNSWKTLNILYDKFHEFESVTVYRELQRCPYKCSCNPHHWITLQCCCKQSIFSRMKSCRWNRMPWRVLVCLSNAVSLLSCDQIGDSSQIRFSSHCNTFFL